MSQRDPRLPLLDIRDHAMEAIALVEGRSRDDLPELVLNIGMLLETQPGREP